MCVSVGSHWSTTRTLRSVLAPPQLVHRIEAGDAHGDGRKVDAFGERVVDRVRPADDRDDLVLLEQGQGRREPVRGAVRVEQPLGLARRGDRVGRGEDPRAHPPQRTVRGMVREHPPARHDEARRFGREAGERVRRFTRERVVGDAAARHRPQSLGRCHVTPHGDSGTRQPCRRG